jgi:hypothetical protein
MTNYTTLPALTITAPSMTVDPQMTITPAATTVVRNVALWTATFTVLEPPSVSIVWKSVYATCTVPARQRDPPKHRVLKNPLPTARPAQKAVVPGSKWGQKEKREFLDRRSERMHALAKRGQDVPVVTFTDTNTANWGTTTATATAPALYVTDFITSKVNVVVTPTPVTIIEGESTARLVTFTLPQSTRYINHYTVARVVKTVAPVCT